MCLLRKVEGSAWFVRWMMMVLMNHGSRVEQALPAGARCPARGLGSSAHAPADDEFFTPTDSKLRGCAKARASFMCKRMAVLLQDAPADEPLAGHSPCPGRPHSAAAAAAALGSAVRHTRPSDTPLLAEKAAHDAGWCCCVLMLLCCCLCYWDKLAGTADCCCYGAVELLIST